jgi:hypothetical protein
VVKEIDYLITFQFLQIALLYEYIFYCIFVCLCKGLFSFISSVQNNYVYPLRTKANLVKKEICIVKKDLVTYIFITISFKDK